MLTPTNTQNSQPTKRDRFKTVLVFALWGPPIGGLPFIFFLASMGSGADYVVRLFMSVAYTVLISYLPGIIPALISGFIYQRWFYRAQASNGRTREVLAGFIIGYCVSALFLFLLFSASKSSIENAIWMGLIGGFSGAVCAYLDKRRRQKMHARPVEEVTNTRVPLFPK